MPISDWLSYFPAVEIESLSTDAEFVASHRSALADSRTVVDSVVVEALRAAGLREVSLTLVVNDTHRFTDTRAFLEALFTLIDSHTEGVSTAPLRLLIAAGTHKSNLLERSAHEERIAGPWLARFEEISWHDADDTERLIDVEGHGFHPWMTRDAVCLACGSMEPHYFAGVTGAHKTLTVGLMSRLSIEANHSGAMLAGASGLRLAGNPVHEGVVEALAALERHGTALFAVNQVLADGELIALTAGHPIGALLDGLDVVRGAFGFRIETPADLIVACVEAPLDRDLYQAEKGIKNTEAVIRDGGVLILEAGCEQGVGIDHFVELLRAALTYPQALATVRERGYRLGDHKAVRLRALTDARGVRVGVVARGLDQSLGETLDMQIFADRAQAASWAKPLLPQQGARGLLVADAGNKTLEVA